MDSRDEAPQGAKDKLHWLKELGQLRDGLLVLVTAVYALGYIVWSVVGWKLGLGALPVLDAQYFLAGLPIVVTLMLILSVIRVLRSLFLEKWPRWFGRMSIKYQVKLWTGILYGGPATSLVLLVLAIHWIRPRAESVGYLVSFLAFIIIMICTTLFGTRHTWSYFVKTLQEKFPNQLESKLLSRVQKYTMPYFRVLELQNTVFLPILAGCFGIFFYVNTLFVLIPQEIGGARPRFAQLDIIGTDLSNETKEALVKHNEDLATTGVVRTHKVSVFFSGRDHMLIGFRDEYNRPTYLIEISKDAVSAVEWCH